MSDTKQKILLIDDDKFLLDMYSTKFTEAGFDVIAVLSAVEALAKLKEGLEPSICLIDIIMPGMDGFQLLQEIKEKGVCNERTACIILSNLGQQEDVDRGLSLGADGYIIKASATPSEVVSKVLDITKTKQARHGWL